MPFFSAKLIMLKVVRDILRTLEDFYNLFFKFGKQVIIVVSLILRCSRATYICPSDLSIVTAIFIWSSLGYIDLQQVVSAYEQMIQLTLFKTFGKLVFK